MEKEFRSALTSLYVKTYFIKFFYNLGTLDQQPFFLKLNFSMENKNLIFPPKIIY